MSKLFLIVLLSCAVFAQQSVVDFAPLEVGNCWRYLYQTGGARYADDSMIITITIQSRHVANNDTTVLLNVNQTGRYLHTISVIEYLDSVVIHADLITPGIGYRCLVNPFWKSHAVRMDSLSSEQFGENMVTFYSRSIVPSGGYGVYWDSKYIQNIGLYYDRKVITAIAPGEIEIRLLAFNNDLLPTHSTNNTFSGLMSPVIVNVLPDGQIVLNSGSQMKGELSVAIYDLGGRLVYKGNHQVGANADLKLSMPNNLHGCYLMRVVAGKEVVERRLMLR